MKIYVPGNLLLFGEYAITHSGGLGISVATQEKLVINTLPAKELIISGIFGNVKYQWKAGAPYPNSLIEHIVKTLNRFPAVHIHIDSSELYYPNGKKRGFGSSAATTIGLVYALMHDRIKTEDDLIDFSLKLHRSFQNGKGSGYDIITSCKGGAGLFQGGEIPYWKPLNPNLYRGLYLINGDTSCDTRSVLNELDHFKNNSSNRFDQFIRVSNKLVSGLTQSLHCFKRASLLNRWINRHLSQNIPWNDYTVKPLGAGGEIGATFQKREDGELLRICPRGIQCLP